MAEQASQGTPSPAGGQQPGAGAGAGGGDFGGMLMMMVGVVLFMYFMMIRPQRQEQKKKEEMLSRLKEKSKVITFFGLYGTVVEIDGDEVVLLVDNKKDVKMRFRRSVIETIVDAQEEKKA